MSEQINRERVDAIAEALGADYVIDLSDIPTHQLLFMPYGQIKEIAHIRRQQQLNEEEN